MPPRRPRSWSLVALLGLVASLMLGAGAVAQPGTPAGTPGGTPAVASGATPAATPGGAALPLPRVGERRDAFATFVADSLAELGVPGASVVVVQGGEVVFLEGYGVREAGGAAPVTPETLFEVGSITKPFTSLLAATLVDDGLARWDTPVAELLPGFALADPALAERLTLADLLCACSGLPGRDEAVFWNADALDAAGLVAGLADEAPTAPFGERFQYSNWVYSAGGFAAAAAAGAAPDDLAAGYRRALRDRVLNPIGMPRSGFVLDAVLASGDYALPHAIDLDGQTVPLPLLQAQRPLDPIEPAAGLWSSAREQGAWLRTLLAGGVAPDGTRVVSRDGLERIWTQRVALPEAVAQPTLRGYGLGWFVGEAGGWRMVSHSGSTGGFLAEMALLPEAGLGVTVLTNGGNGAALAFGVRQRLFELLLGVPETAALSIDQIGSAVAGLLAGQRALLGELDPAAVAPFLGRYPNPTLGEVDLSLRDGRLIFDAGAVRSELLPLRTRPNPDPGYACVNPGALGAAPVVLRRDAGGRPELALIAPPQPIVEAITGVPAPTYVFSMVTKDPVATPTP